MAASQVSTTRVIPPLNGAPALGGGLPYLGHALEFRRDPLGLLQRGRDQYGDVFFFPLMGQRVMALTGPRASEAFFRAPDSQLSPKEAYRFTVPIFGKGVAYDCDPAVMDEQLGLVFPALREERLQAYARIMAEEAEAYSASWGAEGVLDLYTATNELTTFIASRCLVGEEFRRNLSTEFAGLYHDMEKAINMLAFFHPYLPVPSFRRRDRARARMGEMISAIVAERKAGGRKDHVDFLETLMSARYSDGRTLTDHEITGLLLTLIFAGQHTSAVMAAWTGILLLQHRQYLPGVMAEQKDVFGGRGEMTLDALKRLSWLERCIKEAERMRPPLIMLMRTVLKEFEFGGQTASPGSLALVSPAISHRIGEVFSNPDKYDPERFAPGREEDRKFNYALIGFGGGKHRCIGLTFAYQQIKVIWSVWLRQFDFELLESDYAPDYAGFVVGPRQPCRVRYRRKEKRL